MSDNDEDAARPYANKEYKVVILNADLNKCLSWEGSNYEVDYDRMYIKNDGKQWKAYDTYKKEYSLSQFKDIFNPECHAFIDMSSSQQLNSTSKKYLKKIITGDALGLTDEIVVDYPGRSIGLWAFINPINGVNVTSSCLLEKHRNF